MNISELGFLRVAAASPKVRVADCDYNTNEIKKVIEKAIEESVDIICLPELSITSYSCGDLFFQERLIEKAMSSLIELTEFVEQRGNITVVVGVPVRIKSNLYNMAAVLTSEGVKGLIPKKYLPNHREFQEKRWFSSGASLNETYLKTDNYNLPIYKDGAVFNTGFGNFGIEICEDLWVRTPPSSESKMKDADIIFNLSASNELVGKNRYRKSLVLQQSARCNSTYVYASAGVGESTTDLVFSGSCFIAENGSMLAESNRFSFESELIIADTDINTIRHEKMVNSYYDDISAEDQCIIEAEVPFYLKKVDKIYRTFRKHPFIPSDKDKEENLTDLYNIQAHALAKRLLHTGIKTAVIGISGGLDSTLALLITTYAFDLIGLPRENIHGITMPGFGTTNRTYSNATELMKSEGITIKEISIVDAVNQHFRDIEHDIDIKDITYENSQARERTQILMDWANKVNGLVVGTGNMSELALGWTTYNGDHMSMYAVNSGVPKTLVATMVRWISDNHLNETSKKIVHDILDTPFSPELLPSDSEGNIAQETESFVGPYELHDLFLYRMLRYGDNPKRILFIAEQAFEGKYSHEEILKWLKVFYRRFFSQQFKRSCMPDGPKVGSVNLSPRGSWRMPSDAVVDVWLQELD